MDSDLAGLSREQLVVEVHRLRDGIRRHRDSTGHDLCWHHPELWALLPEKTDPVPAVPPWPEFLEGCVRYRQSLDKITSYKSANSSHAPEDWPRRFEKHLNAGELEEVVALYDPDARIVAPTGEELIGRERIRVLLAEMISANAQLHGRVTRAVSVGDIAQLYTDFEGTMLNDSGETLDVSHRAIEVLRRRPDGSWKLIVGDPNGRDPC